MINAGEKFLNIAFQNPALLGIIFGNFPAKITKAIYCFVRSFANSAGIGVKNEFPVKIWIQNPINGVMNQPVANAGFMNISRLRIINFERLITAVPISLIYQFLMERENIIRKMQRKFSHILSFPFSAQKFLPGNKQTFYGYDIIINMAKPFTLSLSLSNSPSILQRIKEGYLIWMNISPHIQKNARYTIGARIENKFLDLLEKSYLAYFAKKEDKMEKILECVLLLDTLKFIISVAWEGKLISNKQFANVSGNLEEIGKMLGGWKNSLGNLQKKNRDL
jgi:hypothetical protein